VWANEIRRIVLDESRRANVGHIGSSLSVADILAVLYSSVLQATGPDDPDRDRFVMSKGHAALALYAALCLRGWLSREEVSTYCSDGSPLGVHPERALAGVDFTTGSLGHGLSYATGAALAARMQGSDRRAFALLSDAECNEGSVWESVMFAAHHRLGNVVAMIDANGQQALGYTRDVLDLSPLPARFDAFGWDVCSIDGHDHAQLMDALTRSTQRPRAIIANTIFGQGVSFMERQIAWHYWPMSDVQYAQALQEIEQQACAAPSSAS
jgi:transketolase